MRFTRYAMYKSIFARLTLPLRGDILGISGLKYFRGSKNFTPSFKIIADKARITEANYPEIDILKLPYADNSFDVAIADQVLEHVEGDPQKAVDEIRRVLKPGGIAIITSVFIQPVHWGPKDMWRFSPEALNYLCRNFSEILDCSGWGNRWAHALFFVWPGSRDWEIPERRLSIKHYLTTYNDSKYPLTTWIIVIR